MAIGALPRWHRVSGGQRESHRRVIEFSVQPVIAAVATLAVAGELGRHVIGIGGRLEILEMARRASGGHGLELAVRRALVAGIAIDSSMRAR